jgi:hypothetical protein
MLAILVLGALALFASGSFLLAPRRNKLGVIVSLGAAVLFATCAGVAADFTKVLLVGTEMKLSPLELAQITLVGLGESLAPLVLGSSLLTVVSLFAAVGYRRLPPN